MGIGGVFNIFCRVLKVEGFKGGWIKQLGAIFHAWASGLEDRKYIG